MAGLTREVFGSPEGIGREEKMVLLCFQPRLNVLEEVPGNLEITSQGNG